MIVKNINNSGTKLNVLIAPLDWGLGHATRCIPIIKTLLAQNINVVIAASGNVVILLHQEFPALKIIELKGYNIRYSGRKIMFGIKILLQLPKIMSAIHKENKWLQGIVARENIDGVISDNRPGLSHKDIPCVYITHQLGIQTGNTFLNTITRKIHYHFINEFPACWVPDNVSEDIAGVLSHPLVLPETKVAYLGILSRFEKKECKKKYDFLLLVSGPEPQRSIFEKILIKEFEHSTFSFALVRGMPGNSGSLNLSSRNAIVYDHLPAEALSTLIQESETVIARSGYSTIMDLVTLQQKAVLVPTPGQTEQEYLGSYLMKKKMFLCVQQDKFSLQEIITTMRTWKPATFDLHTKMNTEIIISWLEKLRGTTSK